MERPNQSTAMRGRFARTFSLSRASRISGIPIDQIEAAIQRGELPVTFIPRRALDADAFSNWTTKRFNAEQEVR